MAKTYSEMLELGTIAPRFSLPDTDGSQVSLDDFHDAKAYLVMFICNHCPFVIHVADQIAALGNEYMAKGVAVYAINSNDIEKYPADSPSKMRDEKALRNYDFWYLFDETQEVAKSYKAACTPEFYVFNKDKVLTYRGQMDESRPGNDIPVTGQALRAALDQTLSSGFGPDVQKPSMGCNIKWKPGNEPSYY